MIPLLFMVRRYQKPDSGLATYPIVGIPRALSRYATQLPALLRFNPTAGNQFAFCDQALQRHACIVGEVHQCE